MALLDAGARESLADVVSKVLRKVLSQPEGKIEELDDTLLTWDIIPKLRLKRPKKSRLKSHKYRIINKPMRLLLIPLELLNYQIKNLLFTFRTAIPKRKIDIIHKHCLYFSINCAINYHSYLGNYLIDQSRKLSWTMKKLRDKLIIKFVC